MATPLSAEIPNPQPPPVTEEQADTIVSFSTNESLPSFAVAIINDVVTVGRRRNQDVVLEGELASREHVRIERKPNGRYYIMT